jgi:tight adherence protein B
MTAAVCGMAHAGLRVVARLAVVLSAVAGMAAPAWAADDLPASLSDLRVTEDQVTGTLVLRSDEAVTVDPDSVTATVGGTEAPVTVERAEQQQRSTMLVIDTSGSMGAAGMATVRSAVKEFLDTVPDDVEVGVVSFADTAGVDVAPTTDHAEVARAVGGLVAGGETALYEAVQDAVDGLGTEGERSIILLSDGGDTVEKNKGGAAREKKERKAALESLEKSKVRAEVISFKSDEADANVLQQFADAGGGSVASAGNDAAVNKAFAAAARTLDSQAVLTITRPAGVTGTADVVVKGVAGGSSFTATAADVDLGDTAPIPAPSETSTPLETSGSAPASVAPSITAAWLWPSVGLLALGLFLLVIASSAAVFRSRRRERVLAVGQYGLVRPEARRTVQASPSAISQSLVDMGDRVMEGRESTSRTMALIDRADLPFRAGEWFLLRILAVLVAVALLVLLFRDHLIVALVIGVVLGILLPPVALRALARRRANRFERVLPDVLMLVATSLASGFSLLQALDSVAKDAPEPAAKEFSRALAESRIGADVSDALEHMAGRMDSENMRWTVMAIRIQRDVGGNLAETLRTTAATLREREQLRRHVRALSAEGRLSAYILIALPILLLLWLMFTNYDYVSLLWSNILGIIMSVAGIIAMVIGIIWMRNVVKIEV